MFHKLFHIFTNNLYFNFVFHLLAVCFWHCLIIIIISGRCAFASKWGGTIPESIAFDSEFSNEKNRVDRRVQYYKTRSRTLFLDHMSSYLEWISQAGFYQLHQLILLHTIHIQKHLKNQKNSLVFGSLEYFVAFNIFESSFRDIVAQHPSVTKCH